jgi:hypothetical protein
MTNGGQNPGALVKPQIAGKWMFISTTLQELLIQKRGIERLE